MITIPLERANRWLLQKQHLSADAPGTSVAQVIDDCLGLHGTEMMTPYLSLRARLPGFQRDDLYNALYRQRSLGRIRCVRRTLYVLSHEQMAIMHAATRDLLEREIRAYLAFVGLDEDALARLSTEVLDELGDEGLTTRELGQRLDWDVKSRRAITTLCNRRILTRGEPRKGWRDRMARYYCFASYYPTVDLCRDPQEALCDLVGHYLRAFGPATIDDLAWWTGLTKRALRAAMAQVEGLLEIAVEPFGAGYWLFQDEIEPLMALAPADEPAVSVLPLLDGMLMGYKDRRRFYDDDLRPYAIDRSGNVTTLVLVDGQAAAVWDYRDKKTPTVWWHPLVPLESDLSALIGSELDQVGSWIADAPVELVRQDEMEPIASFRAGRFMHPLSPKS